MPPSRASPNANETMERTASCCIGDMFFRKRNRFASDAYTASSLKPKIPLHNSDVGCQAFENKVPLPPDSTANSAVASSSSHTPPPDAMKPGVSDEDRTLPVTATQQISLNSKYQPSIDDNSRMVTGVAGTVAGRTVPSFLPPPAEVSLLGRTNASDSYTRAVVRQPLTASQQQLDNDDPPPQYTPMAKCDAVAKDFRAPRMRKVRAGGGTGTGGAGIVKEHEAVMQTLWLENQQQPTPHRSTTPLVSNLRTIHITDKTTGNTYRRGRLLGKGGFARCYEMTDIETNTVYAGKVISKTRLSKPRQREKINREIELHRSLTHANIVKFHSFFEDDVNIYFILEFCSRKSLVDILKTRQTLTEPEVRFYMTQLITGCQYIHANHIIHRDLKLGNMLINEDMQVKIADFGLATRIDYRGEKKMTVCGTPNYIAPEVIQRRGHSYEADIWSIGCIMYTLLCGRPPFETSSLKETYERIATNHYSIPSFVSGPARDLITQLLSHNPHDRPSLAAVLRHEYFSSGHLPTSLHVNCCYSTPKFPAFEAPRPRSITGPPNPVQETKVVNQHLRRALSQRPPPVRKLVESPVVINADLNSPKQTFANEKALFAEKITRTDSTASRMCSAIRLYKTLTGCLDVMPPDSFPTPVGQCQQTWVTKWVDYSNKYGFGYQLSDGSVGILYNDTTRMVMLTDGKTLQYNDLSNKVLSLTKECVPSDLQKKVTLLVYFSQYMDEHLIYGAEIDSSKQKHRSSGAAELALSPGCSGLMSNGVFMKKWFRTDRAIVMHLSNGTLQVNFFDDHTKVILSVDCQDYLVTYIDASRQSISYRLLQLRHFGCSVQIADRLRYARHVLQTVINIAGEAV